MLCDLFDDHCLIGDCGECDNSDTSNFNMDDALHRGVVCYDGCDDHLVCQIASTLA